MFLTAPGPRGRGNGSGWAPMQSYAVAEREHTIIGRSVHLECRSGASVAVLLAVWRALDASSSPHNRSTIRTKSCLEAPLKPARKTAARLQIWHERCPGAGGAQITLRDVPCRDARNRNLATSVLLRRMESSGHQWPGVAGWREGIQARSMSASATSRATTITWRVSPHSDRLPVDAKFTIMSKDITDAMKSCDQGGLQWLSR